MDRKITQLVEIKVSKNITLPIDEFKRSITACESSYIIVEAETGSGKSTQVPQWFLERCMSVLVAEPLIETVIGTAEFVAQQVGCELGTTVGYRTGQQHCDSQETKILFATDGLAMVRELAGHNHYDVLVIDELHQWNSNQSTLEAWAWKGLQEGTLPFKKVIVLSATIDSVGLSKKRGNAPIFKVHGRSFPIVDRKAGPSIASDVAQLVNEGYDVLVFQPGKAEINDLISNLKLIKVNAELFPFHGGLEREEKNKVYRSYTRPKVIVSTNALETGRTVLPSKGRMLAIVDSGMERRIELVNGVETLILAPISKAQAKQRRGRTGRVSEGVYIDHCLVEKRSMYPTPEIRRTRLDQTVLRLAVFGFDALELPFFHELDNATVIEAKRSLRVLGAMTNSGKVTEIGREMSRLPLSVQYARMIVEAQNLGVLDDVITIAAILEQGGINDRSEAWKGLVGGEEESDLMAQLQLWKAAQKMTNSQRKERGIHVGAFRHVKETYQKLVEVLQHGEMELTSTGSRENILRACVTGMVDHLFRHEFGRYRNGDGIYRELGRGSVVSKSDWIVGVPKGIQIKTWEGPKILKLVVMATKVTPSFLAEVAPHLVSTKLESDYWYDQKQQEVVVTKITTFNEQEISSEVVKAPKCGKATEALVKALVSCKTGHPAEEQNTALQYAIVQLASRGESVQLFGYDELVAHYRKLVGDATSFEALAQRDLTVNPMKFVASAELTSELAQCEKPSLKELLCNGDSLRGELNSILWLLPYGELRMKLEDLSYNYPSVPVKLVPWMVEVQSVLAQARKELSEAEAARLELERRRQEELRRQEAERLERARQRTELNETAKQLQSQANELLESEKCEYFYSDVLEGLEKIKNCLLPYDLDELRKWIENAKEIISKAEATEIPSDNPADVDLSKLLGKYGGDVKR
jgi:HrpA-like RNA helicase